MLFRDTFSSLGHHLAYLQSSAQVQIRFRNSADEYNGDPWGKTLRSISYHVVTVDCIMTMALPETKHTSRAKFTRCIKKLRKEKWQCIFGDEYRLPREFDYDAEIRKIFMTPTHKS
jgi:hypothetical protein